MLTHQAHPLACVELAHHDDRAAEGHGQQRERVRARVVERAGGDVDLVEAHPQLLQQREHQLGVGARAPRALGLARGARGVDHRRAQALGPRWRRLRVGAERQDVVP